MQLLTDFFSSKIWNDINDRVFLTFGFSGIGTVANSLPSTIEDTASTPVTIIEIIQVLTAISHLASIIVAITIVLKFIYWYLDHNKKK